MDDIPLFLYAFRWNIEVGYYEQKTFWSLCSYMVRSRKGIEMLVNLINIVYCVLCDEAAAIPGGSIFKVP